MTLQDPRPGAASQAGNEASRRRLVLCQVLESVLLTEEMAQALRLYDEEYPPDQPFGVPDFCQRLAEVIPGVELSQEVQLELLQSMWQPSEQLESDSPAAVDLEPEVDELQGLDAILIEDESDLPEVERPGRAGPEEVFDIAVAADDGPEADTAEIFDVVVSGEMAQEEADTIATINALGESSSETPSDDPPQAVDQIAYQNQTGQPYHEDQPSPALFRLRFANFGKSIVD